jgi:hypothetical protein
MSTISIEVDADTARAYAEASAEEKRKLQLLLGLRLREIVCGPRKSLAEIMDEIGAVAQARGLTPEVLESILNGEASPSATTFSQCRANESSSHRDSSNPALPTDERPSAARLEHVPRGRFAARSRRST